MKNLILGMIMLTALTVIVFDIFVAVRWYEIWNEVFFHAGY